MKKENSESLNNLAWNRLLEIICFKSLIKSRNTFNIRPGCSRLHPIKTKISIPRDIPDLSLPISLSDHIHGMLLCCCLFVFSLISRVFFRSASGRCLSSQCHERQSRFYLHHPTKKLKMLTRSNKKPLIWQPEKFPALPVAPDSSCPAAPHHLLVSAGSRPISSPCPGKPQNESGRSDAVSYVPNIGEKNHFP